MTGCLYIHHTLNTCAFNRNRQRGGYSQQEWQVATGEMELMIAKVALDTNIILLYYVCMCTGLEVLTGAGYTI